MALLRPRRNRIVLFLLRSVAGLLFLTLAVQLPFLLVVVFDRPLHLPPQLAEMFLDLQINEETSARVKRLTLNRRGQLSLEEITLFQDDQALVRADSLQVRFSLAAAFPGRPLIEEIHLTGLQWQRPGIPGASAGPLIVVGRVHLLSPQANLWDILELSGVFAGVPFSASGSFFIPVSEPGEPAPSSLPFEPADLTRVLLQAEPWLNQWEDPVLRASLTADQRRTLTVRLTAEAGGAAEPASGIRLAGPFLGETRITWSPGQCQLVTLLQASRLSHPEWGELDAPVISFHGEATHPVRLLKTMPRAILSAAHLRTKWDTLQHPVMRLSRAPGQAALFSLSGLLYDGPVQASGKICPRAGLEVSEIRGELPYPSLRNSRWFPRESRFAGALNFAGPLLFRATFPNGFSLDPLPPIALYVLTEGVDLAGLTGLWGEGEVHFDPARQILQATRFWLNREDHVLRGSYRQNLQNGDFTIQLNGGFYPADINRWLSSWWTNLWERMAVRSLPRTDLQIRGNWRDRHDRFVFGEILVDAFGLFGLDLEQARTRLYFNQGFLALFDLRAVRPEGTFSGSFGLTRDPARDKDLARHFTLTSSIDPTAARAVFGPEVESIISQFSFTHPPALTLEGTVYSDYARQRGWQDDLRVSGRAEQPLTFRQIALDHLSFSSRYSNGSIVVSPLAFGLGGGAGEGSVQHHRGPGPSGQISLQLSLKDAKPARVAEALPWLNQATRERFAATSPSEIRESFLHLDLDFTGQPEQPETYAGGGWISLQTPQLANVELLGDLSRLINTLPLPFRVASFSFRELESPFTIDGPNLRFSDLRVSSPTSRVDASGRYDLVSREIDFDGRLFFLGETSGTLLAPLGFLMSPLGNAFEFSLQGEADNPAWRIRLDPRNILQGVP